ncbi:MAG TPA: PD-(D/E)XK nuclease family protein [Chthonomonadaceae bacterium]|nr:PD-(D/E)XK nuclease family protein [Chthonomonadaceae bacterium]
MRPPLTLVLGPAGAGKTEWTMVRFLEGNGRALLVVSSPDQAETFAAQIAERAGLVAADVRGAIYAFPALVAEIAKSARDDGFRTIGRALQRLILADLLPRTLRVDDFLGRMLQAPGFVGALAERIREWKLAHITPEALEAGAEAASDLLDDPNFPVKVREFARLFRAYETFLAQNRLRDEEDRLRLAAEITAANTAPLPRNANLLLVDGFYRFNPAQRHLLAAIAGRGLALDKPEVTVAVTLPYDAARPLLFAAPERTLQTLRAEFDTREVALPPRPDVRPPALAALEARLFVPGAGREAEDGTAETPPERVPDASPLLLFDAPNPYVEAEMVAREFRRLHDSGGLEWSDCAIILRTMGDYAPILSAVFERYGIPLGVDGPEVLAENPLIKTLLHFFAVVRHGWRREDVIAFLKSGYTAPSKLAADALRRRAQVACVREGRDRWLALAQDGDADKEGSLAGTLREMARCEDLLTQSPDSPLAFADLVRETLQTFGLEERIATGDPVRQKRDRVAISEALEVMQAVAYMAELAGRSRVTFAQFHEELLAAWQTASAIAPMEGNVVRVAEPYAARERPLQVAAVMGLTERVFPRRITEDPFLRDEERAALRRVARLDLEEQRGRADDERFFFYLAVTAPSRHLILSFPRSSDEADTLPSFYLDEVRAVFAGGGESALRTVSRTLADVAPRPEEVVCAADRLLAACAGLFDPGADSDTEERARRMRQAAALMEECLQTGDRAEVRAVVAARALPRLPRLEAPDVREDFCGRKPVFGVSELETYRRCPLQYLLRHVLRLRPEEDGAHLRAQGTLLHAILRRYFRRRRAAARKANAEGTLPCPDAETLRSELHALLSETLQKAALDASPHRLRILERLLADALAGFAVREARFAPQLGLQPAHFELAFGLSEAEGALLEEEERELEGVPGPEGALPRIYDPASCPEPLRLEARDGGPSIAICGTIDRVDCDAAGCRALVLDYKLGKSVDFSAMQRGESLQMPLYLLAVERLFGLAGAAACYDSMREPGRRRFFRTEHVNLRQFAPITPLEDGTTVKPLNRDQFAELTKTAETTAIQVARSIAAGRVEATPGEHCAACPYGDICRTTLTGGHDGERPTLV